MDMFNELLPISAEEFVRAANGLITNPPPPMLGIKYPYYSVEVKGVFSSQPGVYRALPLDAVVLKEGKLHITASDYKDGQEERLELVLDAAECEFKREDRGCLLEVSKGGEEYSITMFWSHYVPYNGVHGEDRFRMKQEEEEGKGGEQ